MSWKVTCHRPTPALSGGDAQRLKLATEIGRDQRDALFMFDEPTVGLHPPDVLARNPDSVTGRYLPKADTRRTERP